MLLADQELRPGRGGREVGDDADAAQLAEVVDPGVEKAADVDPDARLLQELTTQLSVQRRLDPLSQ